MAPGLNDEGLNDEMLNGEMLNDPGLIDEVAWRLIPLDRLSS